MNKPSASRKTPRKKEGAHRRSHQVTKAPEHLRVLMVASEMSPFIKTGGLADAVGGLAKALATLGHEVRVLMPAYGGVFADGWRLESEAGFQGAQLPGLGLLTTDVPRSRAKVWFLDHPTYRQRSGNPYVDRSTREYSDNAERFDRLARCAAAITRGNTGLAWQPHVVHAHDWHAGLTPVHMLLGRIPTAVVFTVHNLSYQGLFPEGTMGRLDLPPWLWHSEALEFYGRLSFMKGGLNFADLLTTVSPTFAREMLTSTYGEGLEGVLRRREPDLTGVLNGLDMEEWNPETDPHIAATYSRQDLSGKTANRTAVRRRLGLEDEPDTALVVMIGRLVAQKGVDLVLSALPQLLGLPIQIAVLGSGERVYEEAFMDAAKAHPGKLHVHIGYDEKLAHQWEAGGDMLLMPSRYEPCGLAQMQSMRYGTIPVVRECGGLRDTVIDANESALAQGTATGFTFEPATAPALVNAMQRAVALHRDRERWSALIQTAMMQDFSWHRSAATYVDLYLEALRRRVGPSPAGRSPSS